MFKIKGVFSACALIAIVTGCSGSSTLQAPNSAPLTAPGSSAASGGQYGEARITDRLSQDDNLLLGLGVVNSCLQTSCIYVANPPQNYPGAYSINVYLSNATGDKAPVQFITGQDTGLNAPLGVAVDAKHRIYVANQGVNDILVYRAGANGDAKPIKTIGGSFTDLQQPTAIALSSSGKIYVANSVGDNAPATVTVYAAGANGNVPPVQVIAGSATGLMYPGGIAVDSSNNIYVSYAGAISVFAANANGNVAPLRTLTGSNTEIAGGAGIMVDQKGDIYVTASGNGILEFGPGANGNVAPIRTISGGETGMEGPYGLALDSKGTIYISNTADGNGSIAAYKATASGDVPPIRAITGPNTKLQAPHGIAVF